MKTKHSSLERTGNLSIAHTYLLLALVLLVATYITIL